MADRDTAQLCIQIIKCHFGPVTAKVAAALVTRGRLNWALLLRFTALKPRTLTRTLLVLIQHNLIWHSESSEDARGRVDAFYEINMEEVLLRLRFGRFIELTRATHGDNAAEIISIILDHGKLRLPDVLTHLAADDPKHNNTIRASFHTLLSAHYLRITTRSLHTSPKDKLIAWEAEEKAKLKTIPTPKQLKEIHENVASRLKLETLAVGTGFKRKAVTTGGRAKKRQAVEKASTDDEAIDEDVYFRINYEMFHIQLRNGLIVQAASDRYNSMFGDVMRAALRATETSQLSLQDIRSDPVSSHQLSFSLPDKIKLRQGLRPDRHDSHGKPLIKQYTDILCSADNPTPAGLASAFMSASRGGAGAASEGKVSVEFEVIATRMRKRLVEEVVKDRWGEGAARVLSVVSKNGNMDERHIAKVAMMSAKEVRSLISSLSNAGLLELQEVPKTADWAPQRTFYLWYISPPKCDAVLLAHFYKTCFNLIARCEREAEDKRLLVEKSERTDVQADETLLTRTEREELKELQDATARLWSVVDRVDQNIFLLRDLFGARHAEAS